MPRQIGRALLVVKKSRFIAIIILITIERVLLCFVAFVCVCVGQIIIE